MNIGLTFKPSQRLQISTGPNYSTSNTAAQYVKSVTDATNTTTYGGRYVFGAIDQQQLSMTTRVSMIVIPKISLQVYMQPLLAAGDYSGFKELARPGSYDFIPYGGAASTITRALGGDKLNKYVYTVDPDGPGSAPTFTFDDPDFSVRSLKLNAVFRWEMKPGSNFYAVWTRQQNDPSNPGVFNAPSDARKMFGAPGDDVILFKIAYWIGR